MRRYLLLPLLLVIFACRVFSPLPETSSSPTAIQSEITPTATSTLPVFGSSPQGKAASQITLLPASAFTVVFHPDGPLFVGDLVSLEVIPPTGYDLTGYSVHLEAPRVNGTQSSTEGFGRHGIAGRSQATLLWVWDTSELQSGVHTLNITIQPEGPSWSQPVLLHPRDHFTKPEDEAEWALEESECCQIHYITGTSAERDLPELLSVIEQQMKDATQKTGYKVTDKIGITLLPRVLGHGGFARDDLSVSYLDRHYAGDGFSTVLHHELIHALDAQHAEQAEIEMRPLVFIEGLAVYLSGGHFKPEPLMPRAAALLPPLDDCTSTGVEACGLGWYIPFEELFDNFYQQQHEIGYLQAGALIEFMVETWGWQAFLDFYYDIHPTDKNPVETSPQYQAVDHALKNYYSLNLDQLETRFLAALDQEAPTSDMVEDVRLMVAFYENVRRYQQLLDPSAYFQTTWLPDNTQMRLKGIVADYLRRPSQAENIALESMLVNADYFLRKAEFDQAETLLEAVEFVLDIYPRESLGAFSAHPLAADYLALVLETNAKGYQPERIWVDDHSARIWVYKSGMQMVELTATKVMDKWIFTFTGS